MKLIQTIINTTKTAVWNFDLVSFEEREKSFVFETELFEAEFSKTNTTLTGISGDTIYITTDWT